MLVDVFSRGITGKVAEAALGRAGITVNKNAIPVRSESADDRERHPHRHAGRHHARHARSRNGRRSRPHRARARRTGRCGGRARGAGRKCAALCRTVPAVSRPELVVDARRSRRRRASPTTARSRRHSTASSRARPAAAGRATSRARSPRAARSSPRPAPAPARRSPICCPPSCPAGACSSPPARARCRIRSSTRTCPRSRRALGVADSRGVHERPHELSVPAPLRAAAGSGGRAAAGRSRVACAHRRVGGGDRDRRSRRDRGPARTTSPLWTELTATSEQCLGRECPHYSDCFVTRMRERAAEADIVIVNHHLLVRRRVGARRAASAK